MEAPLHQQVPAVQVLPPRPEEAAAAVVGAAALLQQAVAARALVAATDKPPPAAAVMGREQCPRCASRDTKFCYYYNYNTAQPRHFRRACRRYWTLGGSLRNVPVGGSTWTKLPRRPARPAHVLSAAVATAAAAAADNNNALASPGGAGGPLLVSPPTTGFPSFAECQALYTRQRLCH